MVPILGFGPWSGCREMWEGRLRGGVVREVQMEDLQGFLELDHCMFTHFINSSSALGTELHQILGDHGAFPGVEKFFHNGHVQGVSLTIAWGSL
jgi:hypothetical protein